MKVVHTQHMRTAVGTDSTQHTTVPHPQAGDGGRSVQPDVEILLTKGCANCIEEYRATPGCKVRNACYSYEALTIPTASA